MPARPVCSAAAPPGQICASTGMPVAALNGATNTCCTAFNCPGERTAMVSSRARADSGASGSSSDSSAAQARARRAGDRPGSDRPSGAGPGAGIPGAGIAAREGSDIAPDATGRGAAEQRGAGQCVSFCPEAARGRPFVGETTIRHAPSRHGRPLRRPSRRPSAPGRSCADGRVSHGHDGNAPAGARCTWQVSVQAAICSAVGASPATVVRRMSRGLVSSKRRTRCIVWRLSHITRSHCRQRWT